MAGTAIFILNPCHLTTVCLAICCLSKFSKFSELVAVGLFCLSFGAWIGTLFPENEGLPTGEVILYNMEHMLASWLGIFILAWKGRFDIMEYAEVATIQVGFPIFHVYMRWILTPIAVLTWANLNHSLCGTDTDPAYYHLGLGKWYYLWGEIYLFILQAVFFLLNFAITFTLKSSFPFASQIKELVHK